jgi:hypothetical protein
MASRRQEPVAGVEQCAGTVPHGTVCILYITLPVPFVNAQLKRKIGITIQLECIGDFSTL